MVVDRSTVRTALRPAATSGEHADELLRALADTTRRDILARVFVGEHSVSSLARSYPMSFAAVQKHVAVLARAGLVDKRPSGREVLVRGNPHAFAAARLTLDRLEAVWRDRVARMDALLAEQADEPRGAAPPHPRKGTPR